MKDKGDKQPPAFYPMRRVPLRGPITRASAICCINRLLFLAAESRTEPVLMEISSPSGVVEESQEILRVMDSISCPVATYCRGVVSGSAVAIAAHGARGFRGAAPTCRFVFSLGQPSEALNGSWLPPKFAGTLLSDLGQTEAELARVMNAPLEWTAEEARKQGLIDLIEAKPIFGAKS